MAISELPLFNALKKRMHWHQNRQSVLAQNVANADSPDYQARDLQQLDFSDLLSRQSSGMAGPARTHSAHMGGFGASSAAYRAQSADSFETTPSGNSVNLEDEMMKVAQNQLDYQMATTLYSRGMGLLRTALGRK